MTMFVVYVVCILSFQAILWLGFTIYRVESSQTELSDSIDELSDSIDELMKEPDAQDYKQRLLAELDSRQVPMSSELEDSIESVFG